MFFSVFFYIFAKIRIFIVELKYSNMILTEETKKNLPIITEIDEENGFSSNTKLYSD